MRFQSTRNKIRASSKPFKPIALPEAPSTQCDHRISTCFQQSGEFSFRSGLTARNFLLKNKLQRARKRSSRSQGHKTNAQPTSGRRLINKDRLEVLLFAKTLQGTLPRMRNPGNGVKWRLAELDATTARKDSPGSLDTQSLSSNMDLYQTTVKKASGEPRKSLDTQTEG